MAKEVDGRFNLNEWYFVEVEDPSEALHYFIIFLEYQKGNLLKSIEYDVYSREFTREKRTDAREIESLFELMDFASVETFNFSIDWLVEAAEELRQAKTLYRYSPAFIPFVFKITKQSVRSKHG